MCCRNSCVYLSIIVGIVAGVILGVLYSLGFVSSGIVFWVYLVIGALGLLGSPLYAEKALYNCSETCFCRFKGLILTVSAGSVIAAAVGLIVANVASTVVASIVFGVASFFVATLLAALVCLANCLCNRED